MMAYMRYCSFVHVSSLVYVRTNVCFVAFHCWVCFVFHVRLHDALACLNNGTSSVYLRVPVCSVQAMYTMGRLLLSLFGTPAMKDAMQHIRRAAALGWANAKDFLAARQKHSSG